MAIRGLVGVMGAVLLGSVTLQMQAAQAQVAYPKAAHSYRARMARAMDPCTPGNAITVVNPGAVNVCPQANVTTDASTTGAIKAVLNVTSGAAVRIRISGSGFTPPQAARVAVQLTFRTTNTLGAPAGSKTYQDETVICGTVNAGMCGHFFPANPNGKLSGRMNFADCLTANSLSTNMATGNIEFLDSALINCDTGMVIARPGVKQ